MVRSHLKAAICALVLGIFLGINATAVFAATATSIWGYYGPYVGYYYRNNATVSDDYRLYGDTGVGNQDEMTPLPTGYMGALARLYKSDDTLCESTNWLYNNDDQTVFMALATSGSGCGSGTYYSKGLTSAYNGNGYTVYYTFQSPNINH